MTNSDKIDAIIKLLYERENDYEQAALEFSDAEHSYRMAKASAFLLAEGTIDQRKATADKKVWDEMKRKLKAEAVLTITKEKLLNARQSLSARQSLLSAEVRIHGLTQNMQA